MEQDITSTYCYSNKLKGHYINDTYIFAALMKKKLINIFLLIVFAVQILPVQQVGSLLFGNQLTEEVPHAIDDFAKDGCKAEGKSEFIATAFEGIVPHFTDVDAPRKDVFFSLPHNHSADIHTPPPNINL